MAARWNDPFRLLLVISLVTLAAWVVAHSGAQGATSSRARAGDIDPGDAASILVAVHDDSPFDLPFDDLDLDPADAGAASNEPTVSGGATRATTTNRGAAGSGRAARQPSTDRGGTSLPPTGIGGAGSGSGSGASTTTGGTDPVGNGVGSGPAPIEPDHQTGTPGTPGTPGAPGVELPLPAAPGPAGNHANGHGVGVGAPDTRLSLRSITVLAPFADPVTVTDALVDPVPVPIDATLVSLLD